MYTLRTMIFVVNKQYLSTDKQKNYITPLFRFEQTPFKIKMITNIFFLSDELFTKGKLKSSFIIYGKTSHQTYITYNRNNDCTKR